MSAIDHSLTRVLLIGSSRFHRDSSIHPIPNVETNLRELQACLTDTNLIGIPTAHITVSLNETKSVIERKLRGLTEETRTKGYTLIVYYAGHGILSSHDYKLYLATADTSHEDLEIDGLNIETFRNYIRRSNAGRKVILLDCCHSGAIIETMGALASQIQASLRGFEGTYVMTSASPDEPSMFPAASPGEPTYFTGKFIDIIRSGLPDKGPYCSLRDIYLEIERDFTDRHPPLPRPQQSSFLHADQLLFCRNQYYEEGIQKEDTVVVTAPAKEKRWPAWIWGALILLAVVVGMIVRRIADPGEAKEIATDSSTQSDPAAEKPTADQSLPLMPDTTAGASHRKTALTTRSPGTTHPGGITHSNGTSSSAPNTSPKSAILPSIEPIGGDEDFVGLYNAGVADFNANRYRSAATKFTKALQLVDGDVDCLRLRGYARVELKEYEGAVSDLTKAIRLNKNDTSSYVSLGKARKAQSQYTEAMDAFSKAIELDATDFFPWGSRADCELDLHMYSEAIRDYTKAISLNSSFGWVYCNRGNAYYRTGQYSKAVTDYSQAIQLDPKTAFYRTSRGNAIRMSGGTNYCSDYQEAAHLGDQEGAAYWEKYCK